jgi:hypothetical protein
MVELSVSKALRLILGPRRHHVLDLLRGLQRPRCVATGLLPEFQQLDGRYAFIKNHAMVGYTKDEWRVLPTEEQL